MQRILVYKDQQLGTSHLQIGVTLTQATPAELWAGNNDARFRANYHVEQMPNAIYNVHAFEFGTTNAIINEALDTWNWKDLDRRMKWLKERNVQNVMLTFYSAPSFMLELGLHPTYKKLKPEYHEVYAEICAEAIRRYTSVEWNIPIMYIQFWNEMKGYGKAGIVWNIKEYTEVYNTFYAKMKQFNIKIGGPYIVLSDSNVTLLDGQTLLHWYHNALYADAMSMSYSLAELGNTPLTKEVCLSNTRKFGNLARQFRSMFPGLEYWAIENYWWSDLSRFDTYDIDFQGVCTASILYHELINDCHVSLFWGLQGDGRFADNGVQGSWLVDTRGNWGTNTKPSPFLAGDKTPVYDAFKIFHDYFPPGTNYYYTESSDPLIEALVSDNYTLLINKNDVAKNVSINGCETVLAPYQFELLENAQIDL